MLPLAEIRVLHPSARWSVEIANDLHDGPSKTHCNKRSSVHIKKERLIPEGNAGRKAKCLYIMLTLEHLGVRGNSFGAWDVLPGGIG